MAYLDDILTLSPLGVYKFNDSTSTLEDFSGNDYDGTYGGTYTLQDRAGPLSDDYVDWPGASGGYVQMIGSGIENVFDGQEGSIGGWVKPDSYGSNWYIFYLRVNSSNVISIQTGTTGSGNIRIDYTGGGSNINGTIELNPTEWVHLYMTWSLTDDEVILYVNGEIAIVLTSIPTWSTSALAVFLFASQQTSTPFFDGSTAWWVVTDYALTQSQIQTYLYNNIDHDDFITNIETAGDAWWGGLEYSFPIPTDDLVWIHQTDADTYELYWKTLDDASQDQWIKVTFEREAGSALFMGAMYRCEPTPATGSNPSAWSAEGTTQIGNSGISSAEMGLAIGLAMTDSKELVNANHDSEDLVSESWTVDGGSPSYSGGWDSGVEIIYTASTTLELPSDPGTDVATKDWTMTINRNNGVMKYHMTLESITTELWFRMLVGQFEAEPGAFDRVLFEEDGSAYTLTGASGELGHLRSALAVIYDTTDDIFIASYQPDPDQIFNQFLTEDANFFYDNQSKLYPEVFGSSYGYVLYNGESITYDAWYFPVGGYLYADDYSPGCVETVTVTVTVMET